MEPKPVGHFQVPFSLSFKASPISVKVISFNFKKKKKVIFTEKTLRVDTPETRDGYSEMAHCGIIGIMSN